MDEEDVSKLLRSLEGELNMLPASQGRQLLDWPDNSDEENITLVVLAIFLVLFAGCMSGLTLVDLEVLRRSGTVAEQSWAKKIIPVVSNSHFLLVTLLLCNAVAMEALPIVLDKMVHEAVAIIISVTAVLMFGEVIPQAICSKYGLQIGAALAYPVRFLMLITSPISYPISLLLDCALGGGHAVMMRRKQLKTLVGLHSKEEGFGGKLSKDEIQIISGALDLTNKRAFHAMTPLHKVIMVSCDQRLDDSTIEGIMSSKPFSRLPVYAGNDRSKIIGLILVKELLEFVKRFPDAPITSVKIRPIPQLPASTPMYDMLKLFRTGRSHMALLTQPEPMDGPEKESESLLGSAEPRSDASGLKDKGVQHDVEQPPSIPMTSIAEHYISSDSQGRGGRDVELVPNIRAQPTELRSNPSNQSITSAPSNAVPLGQAGELEPPLSTAPSTKPLRTDANSSVLRTASTTMAVDDEDDDIDDMLPIPMVALPGEPIGIITIEDVIEELMQFEIADETDQYIDNEQTTLVRDAQLEADLPENLKTVLSMAEAVKHASVNLSFPAYQYPAGAAGAQNISGPGTFPRAPALGPPGSAVQRTSFTLHMPGQATLRTSGDQYLSSPARLPRDSAAGSGQSPSPVPDNKLPLSQHMHGY